MAKIGPQESSTFGNGAMVSVNTLYVAVPMQQTLTILFSEVKAAMTASATYRPYADITITSLTGGK